MDLKILGLTSYEEKAYVALVKLGTASSSEISSKSEVPYGKIYPTLESLENKGLVRVIPDKTKKFQVGDPENLIKILKKKEQEIKNIEKNLKELKQEYDSNEKEVVYLAKGKKNFYKVEREIPRAKRSEYDIKYTSEPKSEWLREAREFKKSKIDLKILTRYDKETEKNVKEWLKYNKNIKKIPNKGTAISIIDNQAVMIAMINSNTTLVIKDKSTVELFKELFESYYNNAEKI